MPLGIVSTKSQHRADSLVKPVFTASGLSGIGRIITADQFSAHIVNGGAGYTWNSLNRTVEQARIRLLEFFGPSWTTTADVFDSGTNGLQKEGADGFGSGAYTGTLTTDVGIEGVWNTLTCGISLQSGAVSYNFAAPNEVEHALVFGETGTGSIWEMGKNKAPFKHSVGDTGMILREGDVVKYYLVQAATGKIKLLRSTRSKLAEAAFPAVILYHDGAQLDYCYVWIGGQATTSIDVYGVLGGDIQDWQNQAGIESLADKTTGKDKREDFTYFSGEKNLMTLALNLSWREEEEYQAFKEFFQWHDLARPFIFVDNARNKLLLDGQPMLAENEMFSKFVSSFKDNPLGGAVYGISVDIRQMVDPPILFS